MKPKFLGRITGAAALTAMMGLAAVVGIQPTAASAAPGSAGPAVPVLAWKPCDDGFQCATAHVPLNYRDPRGTRIDIAVISHLATGPQPSLGWLFFNGGGPEPQVSGMPGIYSSLPAAWQERYNIITFDPRGMGYSTQVRCYPSVAAEQKAGGNLPAFPVTRGQEEAFERAFTELDARCARVAGPLLYHDSTADIARDMNLLREAVGAPVLNFYGASYGTLLGATYANLFPATTGRMILDGNINPVAWSTGNSQLPPFSRIGTARATGTVMTAFLDLCGQAPATACAFSAGTQAATIAKWQTLLRLARRHPVSLGGQQGTYSYADVVDLASGLGMVDQWQQNAITLQQLWTAATGARPGSSATPSPVSSPPSSAPAYYAGPEQQLAIQCADSPSPRDLAAYVAAASKGTFGPVAAWNIFGCADWPAAASQDRYVGPWNRPTATTILVVGNTGDPWTPYQDSVAMSRDLGRARLLTVDGYGHTTGGNPSACAFSYMLSYTLTGALPAPGTVCQQDLNPFP
ncbi:MAG TPA: alpha/beta hydrolase [Trebonia sp.]|nr:alpha/beta hydrolase [Trebonia sp.]